MSPTGNDPGSDDGSTVEDRDGIDGDHEASTTADREDPADAFAALSNELRVDMLRELSAYGRETGEPVAGFAELRKRVGVRDSGRFRYHLNQLRDTFVEKVEEGYRLTYAGMRVIAAIHAGTYTEDRRLGPADIDSECSLCGQPATAVYEDGICRVTCPDDHLLFQWAVPPNAVTDAALPEVVDLAEALAFQAVETGLHGVCSECFNPIEPTVVTDGPQPAFRAHCDTCGAIVHSPITYRIVIDPDVAAVCRRHGLTRRDDHVWEFPFVNDDDAISVTEDPLRVSVTVAFDDERLRVTVDERGHVIGVDPSSDS